MKLPVLSRLRSEFHATETKNRSLWLLGDILNLPSMRQNNLLDDRQPQSRPFRMGGEVRFEDFAAMLARNAGAIVPNIELRLRGAAFSGNNLDLPAGRDGLDTIDQQVEKNLAKQLRVRLHGKPFFFDLELDGFVIDVALKRTDHI